MTERITLLTIDDDEPIRRSIRVFFEDSGFRVLEAGDGLTGLAIFWKEKPDLVLIDLRMPGMSGLDVIDVLSKEAPGAPIVVLSGTGIIGDAIDAIRRGAWDYVAKPIADLAQLEHVVSMALERARLREERLTYQEHLEEEVHRRTLDLHELNERLKKMVRSARAIAACTSLEQLGGQLLNELAVVLKAEGGSLHLVENESLVLSHSLGPGQVKAELPMAPRSDSVLGKALSEKAPVLVHGIEAAEIVAPGNWAGARGGSLMAIPLFDGRDRLVGILTFYAGGALPFSERDREIVDMLASYSCEAIRAARAAEQVRESEANLRAVMDALPEPAFLIDAKETLILTNQAFAERFGKPSEELAGTPAYDLLPPDLAEQRRAKIRQVMESGRSIQFEDSREGRQLLHYVCPVKTAGDQPSRAALFAMDITARKKAEEELRHEKLFSEAVVESLPGLFFMIDDEGKLIRWNHESERIGGYSMEEIESSRPFAHLLPEDQLLVQQSMLGAFVSGRAELEARYVTKSGKVIPYYLLGVRQKLWGREYVVGFGIDITARKELEGQLLQAQKMEAIGTLAGGVAHDFNNLLQVMNGYAELALGQLEQGTRAYKAVSQAMAAGERAATLVGQLLVFSRRQVMKPEALDLNTVVGELLRMVRRIIGEHIRLQFLPGDQLGNIQADRGMMEQVLMNLCVNARDAMPDGGDLIIETVNETIDEAFCENHLGVEPGPYVVLRITDTGEGMSLDTRQRIFEPFFTTKETGKGTGLGLAAVFGIVKLHGGIILCESEPGEGTRFDLYLPVEPGSPAVRKVEEESTSPGGSETVLLAEDDDMVRYLTMEVLKGAGYTVLAACDGEDAKALFTKHQNEIDLLILDVVMPKTSGREVYDWAKSIRPDVAALFCSGYSEGEIHKAFVLEQGLELIRKPFKYNNLLETVRRVLDDASKRRPDVSCS
ncbi:MAG: response regulator [Syntrophobacteraceae bacterium]